MEPLAGAEEIEAFNRQVVQGAPSVRPPESYSSHLSREELVESIRGVSERPEGERFDREGKILSRDFWEELENSLALEDIPERRDVRFGFVARRTLMRTFPTSAEVYKKPGEHDLDRFVETALYPSEPLAVLWTSRNGRWFFAQAGNYLAWVATADVAVARDREEWRRFREGNDFLTVTGKRVASVFDPLRPSVSELVFDMGTRLKLASDEEIPEEIGGQNVAGNHVVLLPARPSEGGEGLCVRPVLISSAADVEVGCLAYTRSRVIRQAFKFLGERYGWGGMYNARDCASLITDVFKCFGVRLPRNAGRQGKMRAGKTVEFPPATDAEERSRLLDGISPGAVLYMEGHVVLYLGKFRQRHYVIQDVYEYCLPPETPGGALRHVWANQVMVTDLSILRGNGETFLESLYCAREFVSE